MDDERWLALTYFGAKLQAVDPALIRGLEEQAKQHGKEDGLNLGNALVQIVQKGKPNSPEGEINTLIECLNLFYQKWFVFEQLPWTSHKKGTFVERLAEIEVLRAS